MKTGIAGMGDVGPLVAADCRGGTRAIEASNPVRL
jgi:hypothetical protein